MNILAFAASSSQKSINKQLVTYASSIIKGVDVEILDINDYEMPLYSVDREQELGIPEQAQAFYKKIGESDALIISFAEHNGSYTAAFKNLYDWTSRIDMKVYQGKPMLMLSASPGPGGAKNVLASATTSAPYFGGELVAQLSVPRFNDTFDSDAGVLSDDALKDALANAVAALTERLSA